MPALPLPVVLAALIAAASWSNARAMRMELVPIKGTATASLVAQGRIEAGDVTHLRALLHGVKSGEKIAAIVLNSPGGSVAEAQSMARIIYTAPVPVIVPGHALCASACFLMFAAGRHREVEPGALIGVHSASVSGGRETGQTLGATTLMARAVAAYGVPASITGRMVTTAPGQMAWLDRDELRAMGVRIVSRQAAPRGDSVPGSARAHPSDWTQGFEQGRTLVAGETCAQPPNVSDPEDFALGCASGIASPGARAAAVSPVSRARPSVRVSDWSRGFAYGRARGPHARCEKPDPAVAKPADWSLGCKSGRSAS